MHTRRKFVTGALGALALPMISRRGYTANRPLKVAWIRQFAGAALVEKEAEFARAAGLSIELVNFNRGLDAVVAIQNGDLHASDCLISYPHFLMGLSRDIDLTVIAGSTVGLNSIVMAPGSLPQDQVDSKNRAFVGPEPWKQLVGKTVVAARGSTGEFLLRHYLKSNGLDFDKDINFLDLKNNADHVLALQQGSADAAVVVEPSATQTRLAGTTVLLAYPYEPGNFMSLNSALIVRTNALEEYAEELQVLTNAHVEAVKFYKNDRAAWAKDTARVSLFDENVLQHAMNSQSMGLDPKYWSNIALDFKLPANDIVSLAGNLFDNGVLAKDVRSEVPSHLNYTFLEKATNLSKAELGG